MECTFNDTAVVYRSRVACNALRLTLASARSVSVLFRARTPCCRREEPTDKTKASEGQRGCIVARERHKHLNRANVLNTFVSSIGVIVDV